LFNQFILEGFNLYISRDEIGKEVFHGTTTVGARCSDGIVLATDTRVVAGYTFIAHKRGKKVHKIDDHLAVTISGGVADAQALVDLLRVQSRLYRLSRRVPMPVKSAASIASLVMFSNRFYPLLVQLIIGGVDAYGPSIYQVEPFGGVVEERYVATGSGSPTAVGYLEASIRDELTIEEAIPILIEAINVATQRNTATGNDIEIAIVDSKGYRELTEKEKEEYLQRLSPRFQRSI